MDIQSGVYLPFFLLAMPIILGILDLLGTSKSTSAMTSGHRDLGTGPRAGSNVARAPL